MISIICQYRQEVGNMRIQWLLIMTMVSVLVAGCATIPTGGYYGDVSEIGTPGEVLGKRELGEGMQVATVRLENGQTINMQINEEDVPAGEALYSHVLTIGKFSAILGSGFTGKENIYYRKRIGADGKDIFKVGGRNYLVTWDCNYRNPLTWLVADFYTVTIQRLYSPAEIEATR